MLQLFTKIDPKFCTFGKKIQNKAIFMTGKNLRRAENPHFDGYTLYLSKTEISNTSNRLSNDKAVD